MFDAASGGRSELMPTFVTVSGSFWYWNASLFLGDTCHVIWSALIDWVRFETSIEDSVFTGFSRSIYSCESRYHSLSRMIGPEIWIDGWNQSKSGTSSEGRLEAPPPSSLLER